MILAATPPPCKIGDFLSCESRGLVEVKGFSDAPVPWPFTTGFRLKRAFIITGDLIDAIKQASEKDVSETWGVSLRTVWVWRVLLGIGHWTPGTSALHAATATRNHDILPEQPKAA